MQYEPVTLLRKFELFTETFRPKVVAQMNDVQFKVVRVHGEFVWHAHPETDEVFLILDGGLRIEFRDGSVELRAGDLFVVPKGKEHRPIATSECKIVLIEPVGTVNTGDAERGALTAPDDVWI